MKIYFSTITAGKSGEGLKGNLKHLNNFIQSELDKVQFKSSFEEFWFRLAYPPMFTLPGIVGIEKNFIQTFEKFPFSRLNRRFKTIDITLKAPELSEHIEKEKQAKYKHKLEIDNKFKNISEVELAKIIIGKYSEALEIIKSKRRKDDVFDYEIFQSILKKIKAQISESFLEKLNYEQTIKINNDTIQRALKLREERRLKDLPKDKKIRDLRIYYVGLPNKALYPYDYQYSEIFLNLLSKKQFMCPIYHHLYIQVAQTINEALKQSFAIEDWYVNGLAVIDFERYKQKSEKEKEKIVFDIMVNGLKDIANIDKLDYTILEETISSIQIKGLDTELHYKTVENDKYQLVITYLARSMEEKCPIFFTLTEKLTNKSKKVEIGRADNSQIHYWLQNVTLTKNQIKIKSSDSIAANVYLDDKPKAMEFSIDEFLK